MNVGSHINLISMTKNKVKLQEYLRVLADSSKYKIILYLMNGEECVCDLAKELGLEQTLVSHHLRKLREMGFVKDRKVGTWIHYSLDLKTFEQMEGLYLQIFNPKNISGKCCSIHDACRQLTRKKS